MHNKNGNNKKKKSFKTSPEPNDKPEHEQNDLVPLSPYPENVIKFCSEFVFGFCEK